MKIFVLDIAAYLCLSNGIQRVIVNMEVFEITGPKLFISTFTC